MISMIYHRVSMLSVGKDFPYQFGARPAGDFFLGKIRRLYLPYAFFSVLSWLFYLAVLALEGKNGQFARQVPRIASLVTGTARNGGNERIRVIGHLNHLGANSLIILGTHKPLLHLVRKAASPSPTEAPSPISSPRAPSPSCPSWAR
ncbi:MAG: hypothetical protein K6U03_00770 [Firmicutes bacterium]|nr:hypothetical protein [Bacillota bacterium]